MMNSASTPVTSHSALVQKDRYYAPLLILTLTDFLVLFGGFLAAFTLRFYSPINSIPLFQKPAPEITPYLWLAFLVSVLGMFVYDRFGLYNRRVGLDRQVWNGTLVIAAIVTYIFIMAILFNYRGFYYSRGTVALGIPLTCAGMLGAHLLLRQAQQYLLDCGIVFLKTALAGPHTLCEEYRRKLQEYHGSQYQIQGYVSTESNSIDSSEMPFLGGFDMLPKLVQRGEIDNIVVAISPDEPKQIIDLLNLCREHRISYRLSPEVYDALAYHLEIEAFDELPTVPFGETPLAGWGEFSKRTFDVLFAGTALILISPLMFLVALLIRLDSRGPVLYVQERVGNDGRKFNIYKFRSMIDKAEGETGPVWATSNDPRTTNIGRFLRKYNLDELPQFINVLRGEMSVVGPRPERPYFVNRFKSEIPLYMRRHMVKSGLTGWAQVNGWRGDTSVIERTRHDLYYVENWSMMLDLKIILKTLVSFKNAY